jgi:hypothetical protein
MSGIDRGYVEILVHTTAPSRGQDDARYRAMARTYLDFEPSSHLALDQGPGTPAEDGQTNSEPWEETESQASYRPDDEAEIIALSSAASQNGHLNQLSLSQAIDSTELSFSSVLDNAGSPAFRQPLLGTQLHDRTQVQTEMQNFMDSWQPPPSVIADSQPENSLAIAAFSSPAEMLELYLQQIENSKSLSSDAALVEQGIDGMGLELPITNEHVQSWQDHERSERGITSSRSPSQAPQHPAELPSRRVLGSGNQSISYTQDPRDTLKRKSSECIYDPIHASSSAPAKRPTNHRSGITRSTRSRQTQRVYTPCTDVITQSEIVSSQVPTPTSSVSGSLRSSFVSLLQIRPPPPVISMTDFTPASLLTESMERLAQKMPLQILYRPQYQTRDLRAMERGYWLVTCKTWTEEVRTSSWVFLGNFIEKGQAGWGVWCIREEDFGIVKVYCWGAVVGYIYLLLYMASESKIKGTGACWIGGDGQAIIKMPS